MTTSRTRPLRWGVVAGLLGLLGTLVLPGAAGADDLVDVGELHVVTYSAPPTADQVETLWGIASGVHAYEHVPAAAVVVDPLDLEILEGLPGVRGVFANTSMTPLLRQSTRTVRADVAWDAAWTGAGIGVAIIDTGIDGTHRGPT